MNLPAFFKDIQHLRYVVMRNWETMPPDGDIDLYVHPDDAEALRQMCQSHLERMWYDIRTIGDSYYPDELGWALLDKRNWDEGGFWVPNSAAHFISLYYHQVVHKGDHRYDEKLKQILFEEFPPERPEDPGVEYHGPDTN